jgi:hypothetical protein
MENSNHHSASRIFGWLLLSLVVVYFLPLVLILLDEGVFKTYWFANTFSKGTLSWFRFLYPFMP